MEEKQNEKMSKKSRTTRTKQNIEKYISSIVKNWANNNIYDLNKRDGILYLIFIILIPVIITYISLKSFPSDRTAAVYCYLSILISALNSLYDITNRWKYKQRSMVNTKLFIMALPIIIVIAYCMYGVFCNLLTPNMNNRSDIWLYTYFLTIGIAIGDILACFAQDMVLIDCA